MPDTPIGSAPPQTTRPTPPPGGPTAGYHLSGTPLVTPLVLTDRLREAISRVLDDGRGRPDHLTELAAALDSAKERR